MNEDKIYQDTSIPPQIVRNKKSLVETISRIFLIDVLQKITGVQALVFGGIVILLMSYLGVFSHVYFITPFGLMSSTAVRQQSITINFFLLIYQNVIICFVLSWLYIIAATIFQPKNVRIIDFIGAVALARFPSLILTMLIGALHPSGTSFMGSVILFGVACVFLTVWQIVACFYAFKVPSGLTGIKLWFSIVIAFILVQLLAPSLTMLFLDFGHFYKID
jgi:hypothetical protein